MATPISGIEVIVGSKNPNKVSAAQSAVTRFYPHSTITMLPCDANPGITDWMASNAIGQPFGARQTGFGAINRMNDCWRQFSQELPQKICVGLENGLFNPEKGGPWSDVCFVAIRNSDPSSSIIIKRGAFVRTEFAPQEHQSFEEAVAVYHAHIMPLIKKGVDLYSKWTDGQYTREFFLEKCIGQALYEQSKIEEAGQIVARCAASGMTASAGPRYQNMLWTRDLAYMAPIYLQKGCHEQFLRALRNIKAAQCCQSGPYNNGYETFNRFGNIPIVCIPEANTASFLRQRIRGTPEEPAWQIQLWNFCEKNFPAHLASFPRPNLDILSVSELKIYYQELLKFQESLGAPRSPRPSFALQKFMEGTLENLTPGTRDSEIHYIRAIFSLIESDPQKEAIILEEFGGSIAKAVLYLFMNVIDLKDGLPQGADSRDIFADILYDSKVLTNAVFLYQALEALLKHAEGLKKSPFSITIKDDLQEHLDRLRSAIQNKLLFCEGQFEPRDFLPEGRAAIALEHPVNPTPIDSIIKRDNPTFANGKTVDCQSLAHAVLTGLVDKEYYDQVMDLFEAADSKIGVQVFVPISGKTEAESLLLSQVKGQVVWPHVSWTVVRALIAMGTERSLNMAEVQRDKLMGLGGCSEWYAIDPITQEAVKGGDPQQGWAATSMIMAINDFYRYYSSGR